MTRWQLSRVLAAWESQFYKSSTEVDRQALLARSPWQIWAASQTVTAHSRSREAALRSAETDGLRGSVECPVAGDSVLGLSTGLGQRFVLELKARPSGVRRPFANDASLRRTSVSHTVKVVIREWQKGSAAEPRDGSLDRALSRSSSP